MTRDKDIYKLMSDYSEGLGYGRIDNIQRERHRKLIVTVVGAIIFIVATVLSLVWLGWQFYLCVLLLLWANNLSNKL